MKIFSFPPISDARAELLILGTMPGERSLQMNQYYGHNGNHFWKILFELHAEAWAKDYDRRMRLLRENRIAVWDVLKACQREGSSDNAILEEEANEFVEFFAAHLGIQMIAFNGKNAAAFFEKYIGQRIDLPRIVLPSTSAANGWMTYDKKLAEWRKAFNRSV
jgi:hypoxanthine-DNA glycosylase